MLGVPAGEPASDAASVPGSGEPAYFRARRPVEVSLSVLALLGLMPLLVLIALVVLVDQGRPVLFRQMRPGRGMRAFHALQVPHHARPPATPAALGCRTPSGPRRSGASCGARGSTSCRSSSTCCAARCRSSARGPCWPRELPDRVTERIAIRPGITGWAQVNGGHRLSVEEKIALDAWYLRNAGLAVDLRIVWRTLKMMVTGEEFDRRELEQARADGPERQRLLVVNRFFHPDASATSQLLTDLVDALDARDFAITVLAGRHSYLNTGAVLPARAWRAGIEVRRLRHTGFGRFSLPGRTLDSATFAASAFLALLTRARPGDVILAKTDPPLFSVLAVARRAPHRRPAGQLVPGPVPGDRGGHGPAVRARSAGRRAARACAMPRCGAPR